MAEDLFHCREGKGEQAISPQVNFQTDGEMVKRHLHTWYLSQVSQVRYVEKNLSCGEISNLYAWQMWRNLKFLHMWSNLKFLHMTDVEKSEVSPHLACVWCGECLYIYTCYAVLSKNWFCCDLRRFVAKSVLLRYTHFCVEKNQRLRMWRKNDKYEVWIYHFLNIIEG